MSNISSIEQKKEYSFEEIEKRNKEREEKIKEQRRKDNVSTLRSYRIKY